jgi:serine/threonine protein kinase
MAYTFAAIDAESIYGQKFSVKNDATKSMEEIKIHKKETFLAREGLEGYGLWALHSHKRLGALNAFLKVFKRDIPERRDRTEFLVHLGLARHHEWVFQGVPYAYFNQQPVNGKAVVGHLTKFIGLQYGKPAEDFFRLKESGEWDRISQAERQSYAVHLASAVCALERLQLVHGDLSGGNIMIGAGPDAKNICCLCDFDGFVHPSLPLLPRHYAGIPTRPLGSPGYRYPDLIKRTLADEPETDESIFVETDRFALAVLICELMVWNSAFTNKLGRHELLTEKTILGRQLPAALDEAAREFPRGFSLLEKAHSAGSCNEMPSPTDWLECLGVQSIIPVPFKVPHVLFFRKEGTKRRLRSEVLLKKMPSGNFGVVAQDLKAITFTRTEENHLTLSINSRLPCALRRAGRQDILAEEQKKALPIWPGDTLRIDSWEIVFEDSKNGN